MLKQIAAVSAALGLTACVSTYSLTPVATGAQEVTYDRGAALVMSKKEHSAVRVAPTSTAFEGRLSLGVVAFNDDKSAVNLGVENVRVFTAAGAPVRVYTYEQLEKQAKNAAMWQTFAVALAAGANSYAASQPTTAYTSGSTYGRGGYTGFDATTTVYNPANAAVANAINQAETSRSMAQISATLDARLSNLGNSVLRTTTIAPGDVFGGNVIADKPKFAKGEERAVRVVVEFAGEQHEFRFSVGETS